MEEHCVWKPEAPSYELPALQIEADGDVATLTWQGSASLATSINLASDWIAIPAATSPYAANTTSALRQFFRVSYETLTYVTVDTNQTTHYDDEGNVIDSPPTTGQAYFGQDAKYAETPPSYIDHGNGTATDRNTGLIWQATPPAAFYSWPEAQAYADSLALAGETDWRLPTIKELLSLADFNGSSRPEI